MHLRSIHPITDTKINNALHPLQPRLYQMCVIRVYMQGVEYIMKTCCGFRWTHKQEIPHSGTIQLAAVWVVRNAVWKTRALIGPERGRSPAVSGGSVSKVLMQAAHVIARLNARCCQI